jgi:hypothetical protein
MYRCLLAILHDATPGPPDPLPPALVSGHPRDWPPRRSVQASVATADATGFRPTLPITRASSDLGPSYRGTHGHAVSSDCFISCARPRGRVACCGAAHWPPRPPGRAQRARPPGRAQRAGSARAGKRVRLRLRHVRAAEGVAHPDDVDLWAGGTVAHWSAAGAAVTYLVLTDGDAGGFDSAIPRGDIPRIRRSEQVAAASILGVRDVRFLGLAEGAIIQGMELRRQIVRVIRQVRPRRLLTWSPEWNWARFRTSCHIDHRATGELALTAAYPDAGNAFAHHSLIDHEVRAYRWFLSNTGD